MMQELKRSVVTADRHSWFDHWASYDEYYGGYRLDYRAPYISIKDSLSTLPTFQKKGEEHSL